MSISANFPHQLALLMVALQTDKLPLCEYLEDPTEKSLVASLMSYMNNRDFRTPITIARKTLGTQIRVKRSTLFNKLRSLKEKGLLEDVTGEKPIKFTEKAIALMQLNWVKQADRWNEKKEKKNQIFKVGTSAFPQDLVPLINRGVTEKQLRGLLCEAKKVGVKLQTVIQDFASSLVRYEGNILFFVIRDILRKPRKYVKYCKSEQSPAKTLREEERHLLRTAQDNDKCILLAGEQLRIVDNEYMFSSRETGGVLRPVTEEVIDMLKNRMRERVIAHVKAEPGWVAKEYPATSKSAYIDLESSNPQICALRVLQHHTEQVSKLHAEWYQVYLALPYASRAIDSSQHPIRDRRVGRQLIRRGLTYLVESIDSMTAVLQVLTGKNAGRYCPMPVENLNDPEVQWLRG